MLVTFGLPFFVQFLSDPLFICEILCFLRWYLSFVFHCDSNKVWRVPVYFLWTVSIYKTHAMRGWGRGGQGHSGGKINCAGVRAKSFWRTLYFSRPRPDHESQSGSWSHRGMGIWSLHTMWEYDLETAIAIRLLTQPHTCERGSLSFVATNQLKFVSMTSASFPSMPSTAREKIWKITLLVGVLTMLIIILLIQTIQDLIYWFMLVVVRVHVSKSDADHGVS